MSEHLTVDDFDALMAGAVGGDVEGQSAVAVGVSGGPDSMALLKLMSDSIEGVALHALIIDHGLRDDSAEEAQQVLERIEGWNNVQVHILTLEETPERRIQEEARRSRYEVMAAHCAAHNIQYLFLGHHMDDQAETFLFRLSKGSGLDGLAGMRALQAHSTGLILVRPLLEVSKDQLVATCAEHNIFYVEDPSNSQSKYARGRLRAASDILEQEGLTSKRLAVTARRMARARAALERLAENAINKILLEKHTDRIVLRLSDLRFELDEIGLRVVLGAIKMLSMDSEYAPRMEKIEHLFYDLMAPDAFRKRTLGGLVFERDDKNDQIIICKED